MLVVRFLLILAVVLLFVSFAAYNMEMVELIMSPNSVPVTLPLYSVIFLSLFAGGLIAYLLGLVDRFALARRLKEKDQEIARLMKELQALRNLPIVEAFRPDGNDRPDGRPGAAG